jgi:hypothetical protein
MMKTKPAQSGAWAVSPSTTMPIVTPKGGRSRSAPRRRHRASSRRRSLHEVGAEDRRGQKADHAGEGQPVRWSEAEVSLDDGLHSTDDGDVFGSHNGRCWIRSQREQAIFTWVTGGAGSGPSMCVFASGISSSAKPERRSGRRVVAVRPRVRFSVMTKLIERLADSVPSWGSNAGFLETRRRTTALRAVVGSC